MSACNDCGAPTEGRSICDRCASPDGKGWCRHPSCERRVFARGANTCEEHKGGWEACEVEGCPRKVGPRQTGTRCPHHAKRSRLHIYDPRPGRRAHAA